MRLYTFGNYYLSSIQQGIQTAHVVAEIAAKAKRVDNDAFLDWANNHKTIIVCNGGNSADLEKLSSFLNEYTDYNDRLWAEFREDAQSLNGAITCVGVLLPQHICDEIDFYRKNGRFWESKYLSLDDKDLIAHIAGLSLAK